MSREAMKLALHTQEPVAFRNKETGEFCTGGFMRKEWSSWTPLYTAPLKREWVGLTDEERSYYLQSASNVGWWQAAKMIEAKLKEKNT